MFKEIQSQKFDEQEGKWILELLMTSGYVQVVKFVNEQSMKNYRTELLAFAKRQERVR
ncbi:MAG: hypothetical protein J5742_03665 [Alphaproteobacteria bacterium]|nr:hypothetical protein [Alphaproteobacteria bacterium]